MAGTGIDVVIPVYRPGKELRTLLQRLQEQTVRPDRILLVNTQQELFDGGLADGIGGVTVVHITKREFDHGGTRHMAAELLDGEFFLCMTQDCIPADSGMVGALRAAFGDPQVAAAYARQLPKPDCGVLERYTRSFNYGEESRIKTEADLPELGIKTFFCSNVCAMYRRGDYETLGGFERHTIFNEDMIFAGRLILSGRAVAYCADARVLHSHNYSALQQFHRNFDLGVSQADHPEIFGRARSENEGVRMVKQCAGYLLKTGKPYLLPKLVWQSGWKFLGYRLGRRYQKLPRHLILACTMNRAYWESCSAGERG